jgi:hypothetical protein
MSAMGGKGTLPSRPSEAYAHDVRMVAHIEIARGLLITIAAAVVGCLVGALLLGIHPSGGLSLLPFTLFGATVVLLPTYLWAKDIRQWQRRACYLSVILSGLVGGFLILFLFILMMGGLTSDASLALLGFLLLGSLFGGSTAVAWVAIHYLTRGKRTSGAV